MANLYSTEDSAPTNSKEENLPFFPTLEALVRNSVEEAGILDLDSIWEILIELPEASLRYLYHRARKLRKNPLFLKVLEQSQKDYPKIPPSTSKDPIEELSRVHQWLDLLEARIADRETKEVSLRMQQLAIEVCDKVGASATLRRLDLLELLPKDSLEKLLLKATSLRESRFFKEVLDYSRKEYRPIPEHSINPWEERSRLLQWLSLLESRIVHAERLTTKNPGKYWGLSIGELLSVDESSVKAPPFNPYAEAFKLLMLGYPGLNDSVNVKYRAEGLATLLTKERAESLHMRLPLAKGTSPDQPLVTSLRKILSNKVKDLFLEVSLPKGVTLNAIRDFVWLNSAGCPLEVLQLSTAYENEAEHIHSILDELRKKEGNLLDKPSKPVLASVTSDRIQESLKLETKPFNPITDALALVEKAYPYASYKDARKKAEALAPLLPNKSWAYSLHESLDSTFGRSVSELDSEQRKALRAGLVHAVVEHFCTIGKPPANVTPEGVEVFAYIGSACYTLEALKDDFDPCLATEKDDLDRVLGSVYITQGLLGNGSEKDQPLKPENSNEKTPSVDPETFDSFREALVLIKKAYRFATEVQCRDMANALAPLLDREVAQSLHKDLSYGRRVTWTLFK